MSTLPNSQPKFTKFFSRSGTYDTRNDASSPPDDSKTPSSSRSHPPTISSRSKQLVRKTSTLFSHSDDAQEFRDSTDSESLFETPVIVEPPLQTAAEPRHFDSGRSRNAQRPLSLAGFQDLDQASSTRFSDLPSRLSGWFSHFSGSTTDLTLDSSNGLDVFPSTSTTPSPKHKSSGLLSAARQSKTSLDRAMRYILDPDAQPDKSSEPIWLMGVQHTNHDPQHSSEQWNPLPTPHGHRRDSTESSALNRRPSPAIPRTTLHSNASLQSLPLSVSMQAGAHSPNTKQQRVWPSTFYDDFTSCLWMTYRSHFPPIRDVTLATIDSHVSENDLKIQYSPPRPKWWVVGADKQWTTDAGWGCMLRTGQSLLGTALIHLHLSREWRRPIAPSETKTYATYVKIISWFLDSPSKLCPFGVHRMALAGKELGKDVGCWFGPSTAAGAIRTLVHDFPDAGLAVAVASDGMVFESEVYASSNRDATRRSLESGAVEWGSQAVLILVGIRLGIDGVNPVYYNALKAFFTWPQSVGISGGRPSSSYFFVGEQAGSLFYLDPHHTRSAIPLRKYVNQPTQIDHLDPSDAQDRAVQARGSRQPNRGIVDWAQATSEDSQEHSSSNSGPSVRNTNYNSLLDTASNTEPLNNIPVKPQEVLNSLEHHYTTAYPPAELKTFHCEKVRKMPFSALDPSMLLGFLCKNESDWKDLRQRLDDLSQDHKPIFTIIDEPPVWTSDSDDLESVSEHDPELDTMSADQHSPSDDFHDAQEHSVSMEENVRRADVQDGLGSTSTGSSNLVAARATKLPVTPHHVEYNERQ